VTASDAIGGVDVEHLLGFSDELSSELRDRLTLALRYTVNWERAITGGESIVTADIVPDLGSLLDRVRGMQQALSALLDMIPVDSTFPGKDAAAAYERTSAGWAQLYRDLLFNAATLPQPDLLDVAAGVLDGAFQAPATVAKFAAESIANALSKAVGGTIAALWPWLAVAVALGAVWILRAPLVRAVGKGAR
jgi:hypothetical protein